MKVESSKATMVPEIRTVDIMNKFGVSTGTAKAIMENELLHSYHLGAPLFCSRQNFDLYINYLNDTGGNLTGIEKPKARTKREPLRDTLEPVIKARDIMEKFRVSKGTALKIMTHKMLNTYRPTRNMHVCEKQYFEAFIRELEDCGGTISYSFFTGECVKKYGRNHILTFLEAVCTDEEFEEVMKSAVYRSQNQ